MTTPKIILSLQTVLRITENINEENDSSIAGLIFGLEDEGIIEATTCYPLPTKIRTTDDINKKKREIERMRIKLVDLSNFTNGDPQCVGLYKLLTKRNNDNVVNPNKNELFSLMYMGITTINPTFFVLYYDLEKERVGDFPFTSFKLNQEYVNEYNKHMAGDCTLNEFLNAVANMNLLLEMPCELENSLDIKMISHLCKPSIDRDLEIQENILEQRARVLHDITSTLEELADSDRQSIMSVRRIE